MRLHKILKKGSHLYYQPVIGYFSSSRGFWVNVCAKWQVSKNLWASLLRVDQFLAQNQLFMEMEMGLEPGCLYYCFAANH